jgi:hypothetical protein
LPTLPTASVGRTESVWAPSTRPRYDAGELQGSKPPVSSRHSTAEASSVENANVADLLLLRALGPAANAAVGGRESMVQP